MRRWKTAAALMMITIFVLNGIPLGEGRGAAFFLNRAAVFVLPPLFTFGLFVPFQMSGKNGMPNGFDKLVHFTLYFLLAVFFFKGFGRSEVAVVLLIAFALLDELHQIPVAGRYFAPNDLMFDTLGIFFVYYFLDE